MFNHHLHVTLLIYNFSFYKTCILNIIRHTVYRVIFVFYMNEMHVVYK